VILTISPISGVDLPIFLLGGPLAAGLKKSSPDIRSLYAYICNCEQISHRLGLLHDDLLHSLDIIDPIMKMLMISMCWMYGIAFLA
jgi:hypothetical protein